MAYVFEKPKTKRVFGKDQYADVWFDVINKPTVRGAMVAMEAGKDGASRNSAVFVSMIKAWSLKYADGKPVEITVDNFESLPIELLSLLTDELSSATNEAHFLEAGESVVTSTATIVEK